MNTSQQIGGALGLAILTAVADSRTQSVGAAAGVGALNEGFQLALLVAAGTAGVALVLAAVVLPGRAAESATDREPVAQAA